MAGRKKNSKARKAASKAAAVVRTLAQMLPDVAAHVRPVPVRQQQFQERDGLHATAAERMAKTQRGVRTVSAHKAQVVGGETGDVGALRTSGEHARHPGVASVYSFAEATTAFLNVRHGTGVGGRGWNSSIYGWTDDRIRTLEQGTMIYRADRLDELSPTYGRALDMSVEAVIGDGMTPVASDRHVLELAEEWYEEQDLDVELRGDVRRGHKYGEILHSALFNRNGVQFGDMDVFGIREDGVIPEPWNNRRVSELAFKDLPDSHGPIFPVIEPASKRDLDLGTENEETGLERHLLKTDDAYHLWIDGQKVRLADYIEARGFRSEGGIDQDRETPPPVTFLRFNRRGTRRGQPDYLAGTDFFLATLALLWAAVQRAELSNRIAWIIKIPNDENFEKRKAAIINMGPPNVLDMLIVPGPTKDGHPGEEWELVKVDLGAQDNETHILAAERQQAIATGFPLHALGHGEDPNAQATAESQKDAPARMVITRQRMWKRYMLHQMRLFVWWTARQRGLRSEITDWNMDLEVDPFVGRDLSRDIAQISGIQSIASEASDRRNISEREEMGIVRSAFRARDFPLIHDDETMARAAGLPDDSDEPTLSPEGEGAARREGDDDIAGGSFQEIEGGTPAGQVGNDVGGNVDA